jgi:hypothetical protein
LPNNWPCMGGQFRTCLNFEILIDFRRRAYQHPGVPRMKVRHATERQDNPDIGRPGL